MSKYRVDDSKYHEDGFENDIDALNDETFGGDLADINDDWEEEHEKVANIFESNKPNVSVDESKTNLFKSSLSPITGIRNQREEYLQDDFLEKSLKTLILDDEDVNLYRDFGKLPESSNGTPTKSTKNIDLNSLRPPSPSILPYDDFMSSVWRPLSPEFEREEKESTPPKETAPESQNGIDLNGMHMPSTSNLLKEDVIRLEDLEAQLLSDQQPSNKNSTTIADARVPPVPFPLQPQQLPIPTLPPNMPPHLAMLNSQFYNALGGKIPPEIVKYLGLQGGKIPSGSQFQAFSHLPAIAQKMVPPPPGLGTKYSTPASPKHATSKSPSADTSKRTSPVLSQQQQQQQPQALPQSPQFDRDKQQGNKFPSEMFPPNSMMMNKGMFGPNGFPPLPLPGMPPLPIPPPMASLMAANNMKMMPMFLSPLVQEQQRMIINKIITPAQAQRSYSNTRQFDRRNIDRYAGFMTKREKEWLIKIFRLQTKVNDSYVEDYYEVSFNLKKSLVKKLENLYKEKNENATDVDIDSFIAAESLIVLPELAKGEEGKPKYIQFDNALGKIQVSNSRCPRKAVDIETSLNSQMTTYKLCGYSQYLLKIERLYDHLLNIEDEDKRMPILPKQTIPDHLMKRKELCQELFKGLIRKTSNTENVIGTKFILINRMMLTFKRLDLELDINLLNVNKGLLLVYRSLFQLQEESHLVVIVASLLKGDNFHKYVLKSEEKSKVGYGDTLIKAIKRLKRTQSIIYIASNLDEIEIFTNNKYGLGLLDALFQQYIKSDECQLYLYFWKLFVMRLSEISSLSEIATNYYQLICAI